MKLHKRSIKSKKERVILSDILPYEIPVTFSNRNFYEFLVKNKVEIDRGKVGWERTDQVLGETIRLLFGLKNLKSSEFETTEIELKAIASPASSGFKTKPSPAKILAATGMPITL